VDGGDHCEKRHGDVIAGERVCFGLRCYRRRRPIASRDVASIEPDRIPTRCRNDRARAVRFRDNQNGALSRPHDLDLGIVLCSRLKQCSQAGGSVISLTRQRPQPSQRHADRFPLGRLGSENGLPCESFLSLPKTINAPTIAVITALTERPARSLMAALADLRDHKSLRRSLLARAYPALEKACASLSSVAGSQK
jgi:hypothetical protein